ncbi:hypothetical protein ABEV55_06130 [Aneurinibacillus thermoaerophilus]|uniref:hypothetical protein n=1 Tax=Aneurinibacillus thermoaerophilus TaxID=143495 RepID=UPI002E232A3A|nr:hypothetical protein [Aneurinibacillus thermoaerophilus]
MKKKGSYLFGMGLMGFGAIMLLGILNLGFLIPLFIAGFFIYTGWNLIKKARGKVAVTTTNPLYDMMPRHPYETKQVDELDLWEQKINQGGTNS